MVLLLPTKTFDTHGDLPLQEGDRHREGLGGSRGGKLCIEIENEIHLTKCQFQVRFILPLPLHSPVNFTITEGAIDVYILVHNSQDLLNSYFHVFQHRTERTTKRKQLRTGNGSERLKAVVQKPICRNDFFQNDKCTEQGKAMMGIFYCFSCIPLFSGALHFCGGCRNFGILGMDYVEFLVDGWAVCPHALSVGEHEDVVMFRNQISNPDGATKC